MATKTPARARTTTGTGTKANPDTVRNTNRFNVLVAAIRSTHEQIVKRWAKATPRNLEATLEAVRGLNKRLDEKTIEAKQLAVKIATG